MLLAGYGARAIRRRAWIAWRVFFATLILLALAVMLVPRTYRIDTKILTQDAGTLPSLVNPVMPEGDKPTRNVSERFMARENLLGLIQDADLMKTWDDTRHPVGRFLDGLRHLFLMGLNDKDKKEAIFELLKERILVYTENDLVIIQVEWHEPKVALRIAEVARERFLESQRNKELIEIRETVSILERNVANSEKDLKAIAHQVDDQVRLKSGRLPVPAPRPDRNARGTSGVAVSVIEMTRLQSQLERTRETARDIERSFRDRCQQAQSALNRYRSTLGPAHPDVLEAQRAVNDECKPPGEYVKAKSTEAALQNQLDRLHMVAAERNLPVPDAPVSLSSAATTDDPELVRLTESYRAAENAHFDLLGRLAAARIAIEAAESAFQLRYTTTMPPILPKRYIKPKMPVLVSGGLFLSAFLAVAMAILADVLSKRIMEAWQIERFIGLPVLGEIDPP